MPQIESWPRIPAAIRDHLIERMRDRNISLDDLNQLRVWLETKPMSPQGSGTKISAPSNCAARASIPKHFFSAR
jgi:hypothetical protein